jgi:type I site-specific restriction-modification system R (restriction) subunit
MTTIQKFHNYVDDGSDLADDIFVLIDESHRIISTT